MSNYEYKILHGPPQGMALMPWASQAVRDAVGPGSFERKLNNLVEEGWEVVNFSTATEGIFRVSATVLFRKEKR
jgi:hypothetical protein